MNRLFLTLALALSITPSWSKELHSTVSASEVIPDREELHWVQLSDDKDPRFTKYMLYFEEYDVVYVYQKDEIFLGVFQDNKFIPALQTPGNLLHPMPKKQLALHDKHEIEALVEKLNWRARI